MPRKYFYISVFIVAIIGLSIVQFQYFRIGLNLAGHQFDENMGKTISSVKEGLAERNELTYLLATVISGEGSNFNLSLDSLQDASSYFLNDFLRSELSEQGIKADFTYKLEARDSIVYLKSNEQFEKSDDVLAYPIVLSGYLNNYLNHDLILEIRFKNVNRYFLSQLNGLTIPSMIFILIIVLILIWVFRAFYLQKNLITDTNEFINNLIHELKTPVFSMGVATKILEERTSGEGKEVVALMRSQLDKMKTQIDKVLELAIIEGKKDVLEMKEIDFFPVLERIGMDYGRLMTMEGGAFSTDLRDGPYILKGDEYHLENAINSLLENAKKYSLPPVTLKLEGSRIGKQLIINIYDQGIGISKDEQEHIFDKYYRVSNGDRHEVKGYGLGLHYVRRIVNLHKGKIEVESEVGQGSTFSITLPVLKVSQ